MYDHVTDAHVFHMADWNFGSQVSYLVVRKANKADGSQVFYKSYADTTTNIAAKENGVKPCELNSEEHLLCMFGKNTKFDFALYKIDGTSDGEPLAGLYFGWGNGYILDFYESLAIGPDDHVHITCICRIGDSDVRLHSQKRKWLYRISMNQLGEELDPEQFIRIHRSIIVNRDFVVSCSYKGNNEYQVKTQDGMTLTSGRSFKENLGSLLNS